jgi:hypothetical protein
MVWIEPRIHSQWRFAVRCKRASTRTPKNTPFDRRISSRVCLLGRNGSDERDNAILVQQTRHETDSTNIFIAIQSVESQIAIEKI